MKADLHIHTSRFSGCSNIDPMEALRRAESIGLGMIALTEHGIRWPDEELEKLVRVSGIKELVVINGQEAACYSKRGEFQGEFLVFGYHESLGSNKTAEQLIEMVHQQGGVVVAAHPFKPHQTGVGYYGCGELIKDLDVDGLEIEHPDYRLEDRTLAREIMDLKKISGLGCSDAHDLPDIGRFWTNLGPEVKDTESLCRAIQRRQTEPMK